MTETRNASFLYLCVHREMSKYRVIMLHFKKLLVVYLPQVFKILFKYFSATNSWVLLLHLYQ